MMLMISNLRLFGIILSWSQHVVTALECSLSSIPTTVTPSHAGGSTVSVVLENAPTTGYCSLDLTTWNGAAVTGVQQRGDCNGFTPNTLSRGQLPDPADIIFGLTFTFTLNVYSDSGYSVVTCSSSGSLTPPLCRSASYALTTVTLVKQPYGAIKASITNKPATGECVFHITEWAGNPTSSFVSSTGCVAELLRPSAVVLNTEAAAGLLAFAPGADHLLDQPLCGVNPVTVLPKSCDASFFASETSLTTVGVTIWGAQPGVTCVVYLWLWNSDDKSSLGLKKYSVDCTSVTFTAPQVGSDFVYGNGAYSFEYAEFPLGQTTPSCSRDAASFSFTQDPCQRTSIIPVRPDPYSVSITLDPSVVKPYGLCRVRLTSYGGVDDSTTARVGPCTGRFDFISDGGSLPMADGDWVEFNYDFFADGNVLGNSPTCSTMDTYNYTMQFTCPTARPFFSDGDIPGVHTMILSAPQPLVGTCKLWASYNGFVGESAMSSCTSSLTITTADLINFVPTQVPGDTDAFRWTYYGLDGNKICDGSSMPNTETFIASVSEMYVVTTGPGSITLSSRNGIPPGLPYDPAYMGCQYLLFFCDGVAATNVPYQMVPGCPPNHPVTFDDTTDVPVGATCWFHQRIYRDNNRFYNAASSQFLQVVAAGVPAWGVTQTPTLTLDGDSCISITWPIPATSGGITTDCYDVQRKDGTDGDYYAVADCFTGLSTRACDFTEGTPFTFQVVAINRAGRSVEGTCVSRTTQIEFERADPDSHYISPSYASTQFLASGFSDVTIEESDPAAQTTERVYVARLVSRCKLDVDTATITVPISLGDDNYTAVALPIPPNSPPAFTQVFTPVDGLAGSYELGSVGPVPAGAYSLAVYSLESGGLLGQYWENPFLTGAATVTQKDRQIDFDWGNDAIVLKSNDQVSVRWTGFVEAAFSEEYTFIVSTIDHVRLWVDDVLLVNEWDNDQPCSGECSGTISLEQSVSVSRKFHYVRIDYFHSKGIGRSRPAGITVSWTSLSQPREVISSDRLFKAPVIQGAVRSVTLLAGDLDGSSSIATFPSGDIVAGTPNEILITARDAAGNVILGSADSFVATFTVGLTSMDFPSRPVDTSKNDGLYTIPFTLTEANTYTVTIAATNSVTAVTGGSITVSAGPAYTINTFAGPSGVAGAAFYVPVTLDDLYGNPIGGSGLTIIPPLFVSVSWIADATTQSRLPVDDVDGRTARLGTSHTSTAVAWDSGTSKFRIGLTLELAGTYSGQVGLAGGPAATALSTLTVNASPNSVGSAAVVTTDPFPPTDLTVGVTATFSLQLRDQYMNAIVANLSTNPPSVIVRLAKQTGNTVGDCTLSMTTLGTVDCTITPVVAGTDIALSLLVDGDHASYITPIESTVTRFQGPWLIDVAPGLASGADSVLLGVRSVYMVGLVADATLVLRDASLNVIGPLTAYPTIEAYFMNGATKLSVDPTTFVYNTDGSITLPLVVSVAASPLSLFVKVDGTAVPMPYGIDSTAIVSKLGVVMAANSTCGTWSDMVAGSAQSVTCVAKDAGANSIGENGLYVYSNFTYRSDPSVTPVILAGTFGSHQYSIATGGGITKAGSYSVYSIVCQPGGLLAQYFSESDFTDVLAFGDSPLSESRHVDEETFVYSRIDAFIDFPSLTAFGGLSPASIRWSGFIMPPATATYTFGLVSSGGARLLIGTGTTGQVDLLTADEVDDSFTISLTVGSPVSVMLEYKPSTEPSIVLTWVYAGSSPSTAFVVPPVALLSPLNPSHQAGIVVAVSVAAVSRYSVAAFPGSYVVGVLDYIIVQASDAFANSFTADPTACVGSTSGTVPTCLFFATLVVDDGTTFGTAVALGDGTIKIPVTFAAEGAVNVNVKLQTATGVYADITGSPYALVVAPGAPTEDITTTTTTTTTTTSTTTTTMAPVSVDSTFTFSPDARGALFVIQMKDSTGTTLTANPDSCLPGVSGTVPDCLFSIVTTRADAYPAAFSGTGQVSILVAFQAMGTTATFDVRLQVSSGVYTSLPGSPFSYQVPR